MRRFLILILFALLVGGACTPRDPLDWKVSAATPNDLNEWLDHTTDRLPPDLKDELRQALQAIQIDSGAGATPRSMFETNNRFCLRLNHQTIRGVLLDGYHVEKMFLLERLSRESEYMTLNLKTAEHFEDDAAKTKRAEAVHAYQEKTVDLIKKRLAENEARVAALSVKPR